MKFLLALFTGLFIALNIAAQSYTVSGYVSEAKSGERLLKVNIYDLEKFRGVTTNNYGFYSFTLPPGDYRIRYSYVGYNPFDLDISLQKDTVINVELEGIIELEEVVVRSDNPDVLKRQMLISRQDVPMEKVFALPSFLGESDVYSTLKLMPGVQSGNEGQSGLFVRGGSSDQNLILFDGIPVYNAEHLFGIFSVFNPDMVKNVDLYKGGFPARYGGRLSSVVDITSKDGSLNDYKGSATIGLIASKFYVEGPIFKGKTSFIVSGRRSYIDIISRPIVKQLFDENNNANYYFYDLNLKLNHIFSERSRLYLSAYYGYDDVDTKIYDSYVQNGEKWKERNNFDLDWENLVLSLRWNYLISQRLFANFTLFATNYNFHSKYKYLKESDDSDYGSDSHIAYGSGITDFGYKFDLDHYVIPGVLLRYGYHFTDQGFRYTFSDLNAETPAPAKVKAKHSLKLTKPYLHEVYAEGDVQLTDDIHFNAGIHASMYLADEKNFFSIQPRTSLLAVLSKKISVNAAYSRMTQYVNMLSTSTFTMPSDLWLQSTAKVPPPYADQYSLGGRYDFGEGITLNIEGFYKDMRGLIEYKEGVNFFENKSNWEEKVETGKGYSTGVEFFLQKKEGKTTGWIGYTLSWTKRKFDNLNNGNYFWAKYDRRHDISVSVTHKFNNRIDAGLVWIFGSGGVLTLPTEQIRLEGLPSDIGGTHVLGYFYERNNYRLPGYHRLDVGVNFHRFREKISSTWRVGFINSYNQQNPFYVYVGYSNGRYVMKQVSIFPILPSISYTLNF